MAVIGFWEKVEPTYKRISNVFNPPEAYSSFDYINDQFNPDTLKAKRRIRGVVGRRDYAMNFIIPTSWDLDEPLDGPGGMRYQTYSLPSNPTCMISADATISCFKDLINIKDSLMNV